MVTMMDVAKYAGVSKMTVSRVLSGNGYVKEETRQAVLQAVQELGYRPNLLAKSLATGHSRTIAYVLPDLCDPFFGNVCKGMNDVCEELGYNFIVSNTPNSDSVENFLNMALDRKVDGVVFHHLCIRQEQARRLLESQVQVALIDNEYPLNGVIQVDNNNYRGAYLAAEYLLGCGYQKIACVRGGLPQGEHAAADKNYTESFQQRIWEDRTRGFLDALADRGRKPFQVYYGRGSAYMDKAFQCGQQLAKRILAQPEQPDAIYCESDLIALGILGELLEQQVPVPGKIALCGYDGLDTCRHLYPRITTVVQPLYEVGSRAARLLIRRIEGEEVPQNQAICPELFVGNTTL